MKPILPAHRRSLHIALITLIASGLFLSACATPQPKVYTIGFVNTASILEPIFTGFKQGMTDRGYVEGKNVTYVYDGIVDKTKIDATMQGLIDKKVDLIIPLTTPVVQSAKKLTVGKNIPVVFPAVTDPVAAGIVPNLKQPDANLTGIMSGGSDPLRLEWLVRMAPKVKRIFLPYNPTDSSPTGALPAIQQTADKLGVQLVTLKTSTADEVKAAIANIPPDVDAIFIGPDSLVGAAYPDWVKAAIDRKLPLSGSSFAHVKAGMLLSYSYQNEKVGAQASRLADQVLKGVKPVDLPVETAEFFLSINMQTAKAIGLDISDDILHQALAENIIR